MGTEHLHLNKKKKPKIVVNPNLIGHSYELCGCIAMTFFQRRKIYIAQQKKFWLMERQQMIPHIQAYQRK